MCKGITKKEGKDRNKKKGQNGSGGGGGGLQGKKLGGTDADVKGRTGLENGNTGKKRGESG